MPQRWRLSIIYTQDNIPVRTVYVSGLKEQVSEQAIYDFFKRHGKIKNIKIIPKKKCPIAFVTYESTLQAANAIQAQNTVLDGQRLKVLAADSWLQPSSKTKINAKFASNTKYNELIATPLLTLNDDCLLHLSKYLDLLDIIKLSQTCTAMRAFVRANVYLKYKTLNLNKFPYKYDQHLSLHDLRSLFLNMKDFVEKFIIDLNTTEKRHMFIIDMIGKHMVNLQELQLENASTMAKRYNVKYKFPYKFEKLKVLTLNECKNVCDNIILAAPNIIELHLFNSNGFENDAGIRNLHNLQKLTMENSCNNLENALLCLERNKQITHLTFIGPKYGEITKIPYFYSTISKLKSLQYLNTNVLNDWPFENLNNLKSLCLNFDKLNDKSLSLETLKPLYMDMDQFNLSLLQWH